VGLGGGGGGCMNMNVTDLRPHFFLCINEVPVDLKLKIEVFLDVTPC